MATTVTKYVTTGIAPGGDGSIGNPFASLNEAIDNNPRDLVAADEIAEFICSGATADVMPTFSASWVCDNTRYIVIRAGPSDLHGGKYNTGVYRIEVTVTSGSSAHTLPNTFVHIKWYDIQFKMHVATGGPGATTNFFSFSTATAGSRFDLTRCIARLTVGSYNGSVRFMSINNANWTFRASNCLFYDFLTDGNSQTSIYAFVSGCPAHLNNCTFANCARMITGASSGFHRIRNCLLQTINLISGSIHVNSNNNASDNTETVTNWGSNSRNAQTFTFVDEPNDDYHLASTDLGAIGYGMDLSADSSLAVTDDIDGVTRALPFDIGADQYVAVVEPPSTLTFYEEDGIQLLPMQRHGEVRTVWG